MPPLHLYGAKWYWRNSGQFPSTQVHRLLSCVEAENDVAIDRLKFDQPLVASAALGWNKRRAGTCKTIQYDVITLGYNFNCVSYDCDWFTVGRNSTSFQFGINGVTCRLQLYHVSPIHADKVYRSGTTDTCSDFDIIERVCERSARNQSPLICICFRILRIATNWTMITKSPNIAKLRNN